jgi:hypothetical protein
MITVFSPFPIAYRAFKIAKSSFASRAGLWEEMRRRVVTRLQGKTKRRVESFVLIA